MYKERIKQLVENVNKKLIDFDIERKHNSPPTQLSFEFLTNKEQGDWAEITLLEGINKNSENYIAVKYGRSDDIVAGDEGFKEFYEEYKTNLMKLENDQIF